MREEERMQLATEAASIITAYDFELVTWSEVIAWADVWVMRLDSIPDDLLETSFSRANRKHGEFALGRLARDAAEVRGRASFLSLLPFWRSALEPRRLSLSKISNQIITMAWSNRFFEWSQDDPLRERLYWLDHLLDEAATVCSGGSIRKSEQEEVERAVRDLLVDNC